MALPLQAGTNTVEIQLPPSSAGPGDRFSRFRFTTDFYVPWFGGAEDGEVEDYLVPVRALDFGEYDDLVAKHGESAHVHPLPQPSVTRPSIVLRAHHEAGRADARVANVEEIGDA